MKEIVFVGTGGFIGASLRYIISTWLIQFNRFSFPVATFTVNLIGCIQLGLIVGLGLEKNSILSLKEFAVVGVLGVFTTFSAFGLESFEMLQAGQLKAAIAYVLEKCGDRNIGNRFRHNCITINAIGRR